MNVVTIQNELLNLPATERARMIDFLWGSLSEPELKLRETAWAAESEWRIDAYESGTLKARDAQAVFGEISSRNKLKLELQLTPPLAAGV
jgi:putative addiction module component (TIGR02574 family)